MLQNVDQHGLIIGMTKNLGDLIKFNIPSTKNQSCVKWGFFAPSEMGIDVLQKLVETGKVYIDGIQSFTLPIIL